MHQRIPSASVRLDVFKYTNENNFDTRYCRNHNTTFKFKIDVAVHPHFSHSLLCNLMNLVLFPFSCLRRRNRVILMGSSHMRFKADDLITHCYSLPSTVPRKHESMTIGNIVFIWRRFLTDYAKVWREHLSPLNISSGDIVFVQTGAWDLNQKKLDYILGPGLALFNKCLADIRDMLTGRGASLVVVTLPPYSDLSTNGDRGGRNNFAIAAFNALVTAAAVNLGLSIHDEFGVILPRSQVFVCHSHYLCRLSKDKKVHGPVGLVSSNMMLKGVCVSYSE